MSIANVSRKTLAAAVAGVPSSPAPRKARASATTLVLAPESDAAGRAKVAAPFDPSNRAAHVSAKPQAAVDQSIVDSWLTALRGSGEAAVALFMACVTRKVEPAQFVGFTEGSQKKTASIFNAAGKHARLFGAACTRKVIREAAAETGDTRLAVYASLSKQVACGKAAAASGETGAVLHAAVQAQAAQAVADVKAKDAARQAQRATREPQAPKAGTLDAYTPAALRQLLDLRTSFAKLTVPQSMLAHGKAYADALTAAYDALTAINDRD
jgi:hypothetical protein